MYNARETGLPIYINGQCPIIKTCSDVTLNLSSKDSSNNATRTSIDSSRSSTREYFHAGETPKVLQNHREKGK